VLRGLPIFEVYGGPAAAAAAEQLVRSDAAEKPSLRSSFTALSPDPSSSSSPLGPAPGGGEHGSGPFVFLPPRRFPLDEALLGPWCLKCESEAEEALLERALAVPRMGMSEFVDRCVLPQVRLRGTTGGARPSLAQCLLCDPSVKACWFP
jgi:hypothetical protein